MSNKGTTTVVAAAVMAVVMVAVAAVAVAAAVAAAAALPKVGAAATEPAAVPPKLGLAEVAASRVEASPPALRLCPPRTPIWDPVLGLETLPGHPPAATINPRALGSRPKAPLSLQHIYICST